jgi:hypothetical protein
MSECFKCGKEVEETFEVTIPHQSPAKNFCSKACLKEYIREEIAEYRNDISKRKREIENLESDFKDLCIFLTNVDRNF